MVGMLGLVGGLVLVSTPASSQVSGKARVINGDTLKIGRQVVAMFGIDAPETKQFCRRDDQRWPCGRRAREALHDHIGQNRVECFGAERDRHGRLLAVCLSGGEEGCVSKVVEIGFGASPSGLSFAAVRPRGQGFRRRLADRGFPIHRLCASGFGRKRGAPRGASALFWDTAARSVF